MLRVTCSHCKGQGIVSNCWTCGNDGWVICSSCGGKPHPPNCILCGGGGRVRCQICEKWRKDADERVRVLTAQLAEFGNQREFAALELGRFASSGFRDALKALTTSGDVSVVDPLLAWCKANWSISDQRYNFWIDVLDALARTRSLRGVEAFVHALEWNGAASFFVNITTILAKRRFTDPALVPPLVSRMLSDREGSVRNAAKAALEKYGHAAVKQVAEAVNAVHNLDTLAEVRLQTAHEFLVSHGETKHVAMLLRLATEGNDVLLERKTVAVGRYGRSITVDCFANGSSRGDKAMWAVTQLRSLLKNHAADISLDDLARLVTLRRSTHFWLEEDEESMQCWVKKSNVIDCSAIREMAQQEIERRREVGI